MTLLSLSASDLIVNLSASERVLRGGRRHRDLHMAGHRDLLVGGGKGRVEIIARNSNCGNAQEQDYVEALSRHKVADALVEWFFHVFCTSEPIVDRAEELYT